MRMDKAAAPTSRRVVFLFTSFPVFSETFLQREMACLHDAQLPLELVSLWGGERSWNQLPVDKNGLLAALGGLLWLPYWLVKKPAEIGRFLSLIWRPRSSGWLNWLENLLGIGYALRCATRWQGQASHFHAVWATAPGMAAWALHRLTGIPFSLCGHAYDIFEKGGDGWLRDKAREAEWIRTSTEAGRARLIEMGAPADKILVVRRGLPELPPWNSPQPITPPYRFVSVGRMVEKMGFDRQIPLFQQLKEAGLDFSVEWIGDGPERPALEQSVAAAGLAGTIRFRGRLPYAQVEAAYAASDLFIFTGRVDRRGDRAGLPNAVAEAMAWGLLVFTTDVGAVREAVQHEANGILWPAGPDPAAILRALQDPGLQQRCRLHAREWIDAHYQARNNLGPLLARLGRETEFSPTG